MATSAATLAVDVTSNVASVTEAFTRFGDVVGSRLRGIEGAATAMSSTLSGVTSVIGGIAGTVATAFSVNAITSWSDGVVKAAADIQSLAGATGSSVESISKLSNQAKVAGSDFGTFQDAMFKLQKSMGQASDASTDAARALKYLGVTATEPAQAMEQIIEAMSKYEGGVGKAALANALFGKSGQQFLDTLDNMSRLGNINATVTAKQAEEAERLGIQLRTLSVQSTALANILLSDVVPALNEVISRFLDGRAAGLGMWDAFKVGLQGAKTQARDLDATREAVKRYTDQIALIREHQEQGIASPGELARLGQLEGKLKDVTIQLRAMDAVQAASALRWAKSLGDTTDRLDRLAHKATETGKADFVPGGGKKVDEVTNALESLVKSEQNAANAAAKLTEYEKVLIALQDPKLAKLNASQQALASQARSYALTADASNVLRKAVEDSNNLIIALNEQAVHFQANIAAQAKASADAIGRAQHDALDSAGAELERSYERGLTDLQAYLDQRTSLQVRAFEVDRRALADSLAEAKRLQDAAQAAVSNFDPSLYHNDAEQTKARTKANDDLSKAIIAVTAAQSAYDSAVSKGAQIGKDYIEQLVQFSNGVLQSNRALESEIDARVRANEEIGRTTEEIFNLRIARVQEKVAATNLLEQTPELLAYYDKQIDALQRLRGAAVAGENLQSANNSWKQLFSDAAAYGANFLENFKAHSGHVWQDIWHDFTNFAKRAFAEIVSKTLVVNIAGAIGLGSTASQALGGTGGGSGGIGNFSNLSNLGSLFTGGGTLATQASAFAANVSLASTAGLDAVGGFTGLFSSAIGPIMAAVPWLALAAVAIPLVVKLFDDGPAMRSASFGTGSGLGAGNPLFQSQSAFGKFGIFNDSWFSDKDQGQAIQQFLGGIAQVDNAIASIIDEPTLARVRANLAAATTTFSAGMEHEATTFGSIMKDRYHTVVDTIDPELTHLVDSFTGTGDELGKFVVDILAVDKTLKSFNSADLFGQIVSVDNVIALQRSGETVAQTFSRITNEFVLTNAIAETMGQDVSTAFGDLGLASEGARAALIELLGGIDKAGAAFTNYLNVAFTDTERQVRTAAAATAQLNTVFGDLGVAVPTTWAELNHYIDSLDLSTEAGRKAYSVILTQGVPAFVALYGTAQDAASAVTDQAGANVTVATSSDQAAASATNVATAMWGVVQVFHELRSAADIANEHLGNTISQNDAVLSFAGGDTQSRLTAKFDLITGELNSLEEQLARYKPGGDLSQTDNAFGEVATLQKQINPLQAALGIVSEALGHFADLTTKYGASTANSLYDLEQRYATAQDAAAGNASALGVLQTSFQQQWDAIIAGTGTAVGGVGEDLSKLIDSLTQARAGLRGNFLTDAEKVGEATATINAGFAALGISVPQSFHAFLSLIDGIDLTTSAGQTLFQALQPLADAFVTIYGTAQAAATAIGGVGDAVGGIAKAFDSTARASLNSSFLTDAQRTAGAWSSLNATFGQLGVAVPATHEAFLTLLDSFDLTTKAGQDAWSSVIGVSDAFITVRGSAQAAAEAANVVAKAFDASARAQLDANFLTDIEKVSQAETRLESVFGALGVSIPATHRDFLTLIDSFDLTTQSGQQAFTAITGVADAFVTVHGTAQQAADAANAAANAVANIAKAAADWGAELARMGDAIRDQRAGIADWVHNVGTDTSVSPLSATERLQTARANFDNASLDHSNQAADAYLKVAREVYASGGAYREIYDKVVATQKGRAGDQYQEDWPSALSNALPANGGKMLSAEQFNRAMEIMIGVNQATAGAAADTVAAVDDVANAIKAQGSSLSTR